jgi:3-hydroxyisobutyrate dehydrogenase-like beta-hydroxyacid dehydrogenase
MTSSAGASGLTFSGLPPRRAMASRMAARSTTQGTPVKSCMITRAGVKEISCEGAALASQPSSASMSARVTFTPSSKRSRFSSRIFSE